MEDVNGTMFGMQYPIVTTNGDTIYVLGYFEESGSEAWTTEKNRLQEIYRTAEAHPNWLSEEEGEEVIINWRKE